MIAIITGDIIKSRSVNPEDWQIPLKSYFKKITVQNKDWQIYRGDSFQLKVRADEALKIAICIKALLKKTSGKLNARISIGIGEITFEGGSVTESNGSAFIHSGEAFENLQNKTLNIKTPFPIIDEYFNPICNLITAITDHWKTETASTIFTTLTHQDLMQKDIAIKQKKDATLISRDLKRGHFDAIIKTIQLFNKKINECML